jgi:hypothetical protein
MENVMANEAKNLKEISGDRGKNAMNISEIIEAVRTEIVTELPALLEAEGAENLRRYVTGYPDNQEETFCCVRFAAMSNGGDSGTFELIIHLALPKVPETDAYRYLDAVIRYLERHFSPAALGYDTHTFDVQVFDTDFSNGDIQALFSVKMSRKADDCG